MATISNNVDSLYLGFEKGDLQKIGAGITNPNVYASKEYAKKKVDVIPPSGGLVQCVYGPHDLDPTPIILTCNTIPAHNLILAINIRYMDVATRKALFKYILQSNSARIQSKQSIVVDWQALRRAFPKVIPYVTRTYKTMMLATLKSVDTPIVPLVEWPSMVDIKSPFEGKYKDFARGNR